MASGLGDPEFEAGNGATTADGLPWQPRAWPVVLDKHLQISSCISWSMATKL
jgi:hypothetical protein